LVREKRREGEERERTGLTCGGEFKRKTLAGVVTPTTNRGSLAALSERGKREAEGGGVGDL
jgi:hypothetical protein